MFVSQWMIGCLQHHVRDISAHTAPTGFFAFYYCGYQQHSVGNAATTGVAGVAGCSLQCNPK